MFGLAALLTRILSGLHPNDSWNVDEIAGTQDVLSDKDGNEFLSGIYQLHTLPVNISGIAIYKLNS